MIVVPFTALREFYTACRKTFRLTAKGLLPAIEVVADATGLRLRANRHAFAVELRLPHARSDASHAVPWRALVELRHARTAAIELDAVSPDQLVARWDERGVPHVRQFASERPRTNAQEIIFPSLPTDLIENPPTLLGALREAFATTDRSPTRFALDCVQLQGESGRIVATDGRQLLEQSGFRFGTDKNLLIAGTDFFAAPFLSGLSPAQVGTTDKHFVIQSGVWTCWLPLENDRRFPQTEMLVRSSAPRTTLELTETDATFLRDNLQRLPVAAERPDITLDVNGGIAVRFQTPSMPVPTELVLANSRHEGEAVRLCVDRQALLRMVSLGLRQFGLEGADGKVTARDANRTFLTMPFPAAASIPPHPQALRLIAPANTNSTAFPSSRSKPITMTTTPKSPRANTAVSPVATSAPSASAATSSRSRSQATAGALAQATALRDQLRTSLATVKELIRSLKSESRSRKSLQLALHSLRELQAA